jgi:hypothetical protein
VRLLVPFLVHAKQPSFFTNYFIVSVSVFGCVIVLMLCSYKRVVSVCSYYSAGSGTIKFFVLVRKCLLLIK